MSCLLGGRERPTRADCSANGSAFDEPVPDRLAIHHALHARGGGAAPRSRGPDVDLRSGRSGCPFTQFALRFGSPPPGPTEVRGVGTGPPGRAPAASPAAPAAIRAP